MAMWRGTAGRLHLPPRNGGLGRSRARSSRPSTPVPSCSPARSGRPPGSAPIASRTREVPAP
eukprot:524019-Pyramimonas_sp.AAC.1